jgi:predicted nucleic acid-binding protein
MPLQAARKVVYDTNIYIRAIRRRPRSAEYELLLGSLPLTYLSSVVSAELNVGAVDSTGIKLVREFVSLSERVGRIVTPTHGSWKEAGRILGKIRTGEPKYRSKLSALFNDVLIVLCAVQIGDIVRTRDKEDFQLIRRYRKFDLELVGDST